MHAVPGLACPACRGELRMDGEASLTCDACGASYPVFDGIPSFVGLAAYLRARGMTVDAVEYVGGSEMVFSLRKSTTRVPVLSPLPVAAGLRGARAVVAVAGGEPAS